MLKPSQKSFFNMISVVLSIFAILFGMYIAIYITNHYGVVYSDGHGEINWSLLYDDMKASIKSTLESIECFLESI